MSFDIVQPIIKPIIRPIVSAFKRWYLDLNNNSILMPVYTPKSANGTLRTSVRLDASDIGQRVVLLADNDSLTERLFKDTDDTIKFGYIDSDGTSRAASSPTVVVAGVDYHPTVRFDGNGVTVDVAGASGSNPNSIDPSDLNIIRMASNNTGTGNFLNGRQWSTGFTDDTALQDGEFLQGNGALYGQLNVPLDVGDTVEFDFVVTPDGVLRTILGSTEFAAPISINDSGRFVFNSSVFTLFVDGVNTVSNMLDVVAGQHYRVFLDVLQPITLATFLSNSFTGSNSNGIIGNLQVKKVSGDTYQYLTKGSVIDSGDGTATAPQTGSVPRFGPELWANPPLTVSGSWVDNLDGTYTKTSGTTGDLGFRYLDAGQPIGPDTLYLVVVDVVAAETALNIFTREGNANVAVATGLGTGHHELYVRSGDAGGLVFARTSFAGTVSGVSITKTTDALIQNFTPSDLVLKPQISRFYPMNDGEGTNIRDTLNPSGTTDATVDVGAVTWVRD